MALLVVAAEYPTDGDNYQSCQILLFWSTLLFAMLRKAKEFEVTDASLFLY